jgi:hypothetical protein
LRDAGCKRSTRFFRHLSERSAQLAESGIGVAEHGVLQIQGDANARVQELIPAEWFTLDSERMLGPAQELEWFLETGGGHEACAKECFEDIGKDEGRQLHFGLSEHR